MGLMSAPRATTTAAVSTATTSAAMSPAASAPAVARPTVTASATTSTLASRHIEGRGTPDADWQAWGGLATLPPITTAELVPAHRRAVIIAPHPDDEVLACGGLLQQLHALGTRTVLLAVTDGAASHSGSSLLTPADLTRLRPQETAAALQILGLNNHHHADQRHNDNHNDNLSDSHHHHDSTVPQLLRARLNDGQVSAQLDQLHNLLLQLLRPDDVVFVTWRQDGHPDHEACGLAASLAARACHATLVEMPVWSWHWAAPGDPRLPWHRARRLALSAEDLQRKRAAIACFQTQLQDDPSTGQEAILAPHVLERLLHPYEIYFT